MFTIPFAEVITKGVFYYPAYKHYNKVTNVVCDRCNRTNLTCSIGHNDLDLCMRCVEVVTQIIEQKKTTPVTVKSYGTVLPDYINYDTLMSTTNMQQESLKPKYATRMMQNMFN